MTKQVIELISNGGTFGDASGFNENDYEAIYNLGYRSYAQGHFVKAMRIFCYLITQNHLEVRYVNAFAASLQMVGGYEDALKFYSIAFTMDPRDSLTTYHAAECLIALNRTAEAVEGLKIVVGKPVVSDVDKELNSRAQALISHLQQPSLV